MNLFEGQEPMGIVLGSISPEVKEVLLSPQTQLSYLLNSSSVGGHTIFNSWLSGRMYGLQ